ncbi:uncharacterized protein A1O9_11061 [Exophiala aquamarina CBS 119918]|uniref:Uncharacterized protein n=1 Tax=Exophiala aquamarina CBS 119918 TaxID=1182545 RepID=A0A072NXN0_9EURO|nr:uncharacterized protein A1O9_11061 [Exophiala aquamarina CBS 119918]KEF52644.1 hypothetical protein A1O9_11061 [Exophiala aquamarina CBS 119918]
MDFRGSEAMRNGAVHAQYHAPLLPPEMIDGESQMSTNGPWTFHVDNTHALPPTNLGTQPPVFHGSVSNSTHQSRALNDILTPLLQHHDTPNFREVISTYLRLPANLWQLVSKIRESNFAHEVLRDNLPRDMWNLMVKVRDDIHFEHLQPLVVATFAEHASFMGAAATTSQNHSRSGSGASWYEGGNPQMGNGASRPALHPSHATSPSLSGFQFSSPAQPEHSMQTRSATPISLVYPSSRNTSRSPWRNKKGKAPAGQLYVCPLPNCTKKGFKNVGNYINHMLRLHAGYPRHDPETSLQPESSPSLDAGEEFVSPAATTASSSPLLARHLSQDWGSFGDVHSSFGHDDPNPSTSNMNGRTSDANLEQFDLPSSIVSGSGEASRDQDDFGEMHDQANSVQEDSELLADEDPEYSSADAGGLSFGMFQATILSARRSNRTRGSY